MLKNIYIDNFRCLVNFSINFNDLSLLIGPNGSGKTTVFFALQKIQQLIIESKKVDSLFSASDLALWLDSEMQTFKLEIHGNSGVYEYLLELEHFKERNFVRVKTEKLFFDQHLLYQALIDTEAGYPVSRAYLFNDDHTHDGIPIMSDWSRSGLSMIEERHDNKKLIWFKKRLKNFYILRIAPYSISAESREESEHLNFAASNYSSWLRVLLQERGRGIHKLQNTLTEIFQTDEVYFSSDSAGDAKILRVEIDGKKYRFDTLSDGQKVLIVLYTLLYCLPAESTLCIDEPENFLALPEIQPWLNLLHDFCDEAGQALLISHHPVLINLLAKGRGCWFERPHYKHTHIKYISEEANDTRLSIASLIERGWLYEQ